MPRKQNSQATLKSVRSRYILDKIFDNLSLHRALDIIKHTKKLQNKLNKGLKDYKNYFQIELELIPTDDALGEFINIPKFNESQYHIYFNESRRERKLYKINKSDKVKKINVKIDKYKNNNSLYKLFSQIQCVKEIRFKKFYRKDIQNMSYMFEGCVSLEKVCFYNFNTDSVTNMAHMFSGCKSLKEVNVEIINTRNVTNMSH